MRRLTTALLFALLFCANTAFAAASAPPRVLFISAYHPGFPTFFQQVEGLKTTLDAHGVGLDIEFMDSKRFYTNDNFAIFADLLEYKLSNLPRYDVLIVGDDNALVFAIEHRNTLFKGIPIVFLGINNAEYARQQAQAFGLTGVLEAVSMMDTVSLMQRLMPKMAKAWVITDGTPSGSSDRKQFENTMQREGYGRYEILDLEKISWDDLILELERIPASDPILLISAYRDSQDATKTFEQATDFIVSHTKSPVFHLWEHGIGSGLVGGKVISFNEQGRLAANLALKIIEGIPSAALPVIPGGDANVYRVDASALERYGIDPDALPEGSILLNRRHPFYEAHKAVILHGGLIILLLIVVITYLLKANRAKDAAESKARASEEKHRRYIENAPDAIVIFTADGTIVRTNPAATRLSGYESDELVGRSLLDMLPEATREKGVRDLAELDAESVLSRGYEIVRKDGTHAYVYYDAVKLTTDTYIGFCKDLTEQRRIHAALEESEERFRELLDQAGDGVFACDKRGFFKFVNKAACESLGYSRDELLRLSVWDIDPLAETRNDPGTIWSHPSIIFETVHKRKDGSTFPVELKLGKITVGGEELVLGLGRDISDRKHVEEELIQAKEAAESANRSKSEFLANVSHELRTPLNAMFGMLQLVNATDLTVEQADYVNTALASGRSLLQVISDVLDLSKIEAGKIELQKAGFNLRDLVESVSIIFRLQADEKGLAINWSVDDDLDQFYLGDQGRIRQILFNLVGNSIKFTEKGSISITCVRASRTVRKTIDRLAFTVADTGIGIPESKIDTIFDAFEQVDGSYARHHQGAGLGLGIVKRFVELMDGTVVVESVVGKGTSITATIKVGRCGEQEECEDVDLACAAVPPMPLRLLLAEDDRVNRIAASKLLSRRGHTVDCAENGSEAIEMLKKGEYDCILMDIQMPGMDGLEATHIIRTSEDLGAKADIPIIALTAHALKGDKDKFFEAGMTDYLSKPMEMDAVEATLARVTAKAAKR